MASSRKKIIRMTEYGRQFAKLHITPLQEAEEKAFLGMDIQEQETYVRLSQKYVSNLRKERKYSWSFIKNLKSIEKEVPI